MDRRDELTAEIEILRNDLKQRHELDRHDVTGYEEQIATLTRDAEALRHRIEQDRHDNGAARAALEIALHEREQELEKQRQLVEAEGAAEQRDVFLIGIADVEPEAVLAVGQQLSQSLDRNLAGAVLMAGVENESRGAHRTSRAGIRLIVSTRGRSYFPSPASTAIRPRTSRRGRDQNRRKARSCRTPPLRHDIRHASDHVSVSHPPARRARGPNHRRGYADRRA